MRSTGPRPQRVDQAGHARLLERVAKGGEKQPVGVMCIVLSCVAFLAWLVIKSMSIGTY